MTCNTVEDVPTWHGIGTDSGQRIRVLGDSARRTRNGIHITSGPSWRALDCITEGNVVEQPVGEQYAITYVYSTGGAVRNNTMGRCTSPRDPEDPGDDADANAVNVTDSGNVVIP